MTRPAAGATPSNSIRAPGRRCRFSRKRLLRRRQCTARWQIHRDRVRDLAIADDGSLLASLTTAGHLVIYRSMDARVVLESHLDRESLESVAFLGNAVVTTGWGDSGLLRWWWWDPRVLESRLAVLRNRVR